MPNTRATSTPVVKPHNLSENFTIVPEYGENSISLNTFLSLCNTVYSMAPDNQQILAVLHMKNKLLTRIAELVNSKKPHFIRRYLKFIRQSLRRFPKCICINSRLVEQATITQCNFSGRNSKVIK